MRNIGKAALIVLTFAAALLFSYTLNLGGSANMALGILVGALVREVVSDDEEDSDPVAE